MKPIRSPQPWPVGSKWDSHFIMQSLVQRGEPGLGSCQVSAQSWLCMTLLSEPSSAWLRQGQALATAGSAAVRREGSVYLPPSAVPRLWPFLRLRHCSKPLHQHYPEPSPDQAQPVTATSSHWQHQPSSSKSRDTRLCFDCRILLSLLVRRDNF